MHARRAVVIGGSAVLAGKVAALVAGGATDVLVVARGPVARLDELSAVMGVTVRRRDWRPEDLEGAFLCVASHDDPSVRDEIARQARARGVLVNVMDDIPNCDWAAPAVLRRGELVFAIATGGASPALARRIRELLTAEFGEEWAEVVRILRDVREKTTSEIPDLEERARRWRLALDVEEAASLVRAGRGEELRSMLLRRLNEGVNA